MENEQPAVSKGKRVLVVEDEEYLRKALSVQLEKSGYTVLLATDGMEGLRSMKDEQPDIVLLDIIMPKMDGMEVLKQVKDDPAISGIPILFLTNSPDSDHISEGMSLGAKGYLIKSNYSLKDVIDKVESFL